MTFDEAHRRIKVADAQALKRALGEGLDSNLSNRFSWTLLMLSAMEGNVGIGELLVAHGARVDSANDFGDTALSLAAHKGHERFVAWLLARGASMECRPHGWQLRDWIRQTSGLPREKIASILTLLGLEPH